MKLMAQLAQELRVDHPLVDAAEAGGRHLLQECVEHTPSDE